MSTPTPKQVANLRAAFAEHDIPWPELIGCSGRCNGLGELDPAGSYVRIIYKAANERHGIVISEGAAEVLIAELQGALAQRPIRAGLIDC